MKQYFPLLLATTLFSVGLHFTSFNAGFNPGQQFYDPRIGLDPQFEQHWP